MNIKDIVKWNEDAWNTPDTYNRHLEASMLIEEMSELIIALKEWDKVEAVDAVIDTFWVWVWTLYKLWVSAEQIEKCFEEIKDSNYSKFENWKCNKVGGKIIKPSTFKEPNLKKILWQ